METTGYSVEGLATRPEAFFMGRPAFAKALKVKSRDPERIVSGGSKPELFTHRSFGTLAIHSFFK
jgi:hypothetical protein